jgi:hypothetical protein
VTEIPTPLDPFEAQRLLLTLLLVSSLTSNTVDDAAGAVRVRDTSSGRTRAAVRRRHVRPARSC